MLQQSDLIQLHLKQRQEIEDQRYDQEQQRMQEDRQQQQQVLQQLLGAVAKMTAPAQ